MNNLGDAASSVSDLWENLIGGDYTPPPCPSVPVLTSLLETINYAAGFPEEGRYPRFLVTASKSDQEIDGIMRFDSARELNVSELRRLIPATDVRKSAVHITWNDKGILRIVGILDLGTTWHRARIGLAYNYTAPSTLLIEVERPNRVIIYQRQYRMATFSDGKAEIYPGVEISSLLHRAASAGLADLESSIIKPNHEPPREYEEFEFLALWNCYAGIANSIAMLGHGGALVIVSTRNQVDSGHLRSKYAIQDLSLSNAFISFINARHELGDQYHFQDIGKELEDNGFTESSTKFQTNFNDLVEKIRFVAQLAQCDGALVISHSLEVLGFGCEITAELQPDTPVWEVTDEVNREYKELDVEQFGMRHRSALKLVSQLRDSDVLIMSQDGPISGIWGDEKGIYMRKGIRLVNMNLPWA